MLTMILFYYKNHVKIENICDILFYFKYRQMFIFHSAVDFCTFFTLKKKKRNSERENLLKIKLSVVDTPGVRACLYKTLIRMHKHLIIKLM